MRVLKIIDGRETYVWEPDVTEVDPEKLNKPVVVLREPEVTVEPAPEVLPDESTAPVEDNDGFGDGGLKVTECGVIKHEPVEEVKNEEVSEENLGDATPPNEEVVA